MVEPDFEQRAEDMDAAQEGHMTLVERLRGKYKIPVNDGAGELEGKTFFERQFPACPMAIEAADALEAQAQTIARLEGALKWKPIDSYVRVGTLVLLKKGKEILPARRVIDSWLITSDWVSPADEEDYLDDVTEFLIVPEPSQRARKALGRG